MARIFDDSVEDEKSKVKKDGLIYQQRNDTDYKAEYEKLDSKGKFQFFKDYYLQTIVVIAVLVIVGGYYLYGSLTKPQTVLYVAVCDDNLDEKQVEKLEKAVGTYLGLDNKHEIVTINTDYNSSNGTLSEQLQSYIYAGTCDVVIAPKKGFMSYASAGYFLEPDTSDFERRLTMLQRKPRARYRINHISWWAQELPSDEEYAEARRNLDAVSWAVDYIITHCAPTSIALMGSRHNEADRLTDFLQEVRERAKYHYWLFGHYHDNKAVNEKHILLWEQIVRVI